MRIDRRLKPWWGMLLVLGAALSAAAAEGEWQVKLYAQGSAPQAPKPAELELRESITQYGITWTFAAPARAGRFVNGDWYVVGPVTVKAVDPKPLFGAEVPASELDGNYKQAKDGKYVRNGSLVNQPPRGAMPYDSGIRQCFAPELVAAPPYELKPGDNLISTISLKKGDRKSVV
jgi:hypothetical protein